jgi:hypothetical protein
MILVVKKSARKARVDLEEKTGRSVVTGENFMPPGRKKISDNA